MMIASFLPLSFGTSQLLAENPEEPNLFGYFVTVMSIFIVGAFVILKGKKWRKKNE